MVITISHIFKRFFWLAILFAAVTFSVYGAQPIKNILIISAEQDHVPAIQLVDRGVRESFADVQDFKVRFFRESLDSSRIDGQKYEKEFLDLLKQKYKDQRIDLIFTYGRTALAFLMKNEAFLFPEAPKVFATTDQRELAGLSLGTRTVGATGKLELGPTMELLLGQNPNARKVAVIFGTSAFDRAWRERAAQDLDSYSKRVEIDYLDPSSMDGLRAQLAALPPEAAVLFVSFSGDGEGNTYTTPEALSLIAPAATNPIYALSDASMGYGTVGGAMLSYQSIGSNAGELGKQILAGQDPGKLPGRIVPPVLIFDWRQLQKWGIDENRLPYGSVVEFRTPSVWEQYRGYTAVALAVLIFQSLLITWLLITQARRRKAEIERNEFQALAEAEHLRLEEVVSNVPGVVWESSLEPGSDTRRIEFVSAYVEKLFGYSVEEFKAEPGIVNRLILDEDRVMYEQEADAVFQNGGQSVIQFRCESRDGNQKWLEAHMVGVRDESGNPIGLRGVTMDITDRKVAEEKLNVKEQQLTEAQRLAQIGSWDWDPGTGAVNWSEEMFRIVGLDGTQPAPRFEDQASLHTADSWSLLNSTVSNALKTGQPYEVELELIRRGGRHIWTSARGEVLRNGGNPTMRGTLQDITVRKKAEEAVRESEDRFRNIANTAPVMIWMADENAKITFADQSWEDFTGFTQEQLLGEGWLESVHEDDRQPSVDVYMPALERREPFNFEYRVRRADGEYRWLHSSGVPRYGASGEFLGYIGSDVDIHDMKIAGDAVRESEARFRIIANSTPVLIWMSDVSPLITFVNKFCTDFTGLSEEHFHGSSWLEVVHEDDRQRCIDIYTAAYERREPFVYEFRIRRADGNYYWFYSTSAPRLAVDGEFLGYTGTCVDINDRKKAEESLQSALAEINQLKNELHEENIYLKEVIKLEHNFNEIIGDSDALKYVLFKIEQVAPTDATVLITGETGTGKELVARAIHNMSLRKNRPLVKVNCAALSATLIESELFGHERGAFTGAGARKIGRFELADGATIFLDEVGELPMELQPKLLRLIQEGEFERLGSSKTMKADVRIIPATNRNLEAEVRNGRFREDLLFRLNVFPVTVPPLRERREDIPALVEHFTTHFARKLGKTINSVSPSTIRSLTQYRWPGNIRELANVIERAVIGTSGETLRVLEHLGTEIPEDPTVSNESLENIERNHIIKTLLTTGWRIEGSNGAARILGLNPSTLRTRMNKLGIVKSSSTVG